MTILPYRSRKQHQPHAQIDDASTSLGSNDSSTSGGKTDATESISMSYSDDEDDASLCYSAASSTATPVPVAIDEGFVVEASAEECSVLSLDHSCISSSTFSLLDTDSYFLEPADIGPETPSTAQRDHVGNKPRRNLIGQRVLDSCKKLQTSPKIHKRKSASKESHDAATKPHAQRVPSIGMGPSTLQITCVLKQGWLYKRGTGSDMLGREGWKHRYAYLVLATNQQTSHNIEVPIILIYRNDSATMPSNIIPLDSAVVMAMPNGQADTEINEASLPAKQRALFHIIQAKRSRFFADDDVTQTSAVAASRSFAASKEEAGKWVEKINTHLIHFEKRKAQASVLTKKQPVDETKLSQIVTENHWLEI